MGVNTFTVCKSLDDAEGEQTKLVMLKTCGCLLFERAVVQTKN